MRVIDATFADCRTREEIERAALAMTKAALASVIVQALEHDRRTNEAAAAAVNTED